MGVTRRVRLGTERDALSFSFEHKCAGCRKLLQPGWHADHILALADGGPDEQQNMKPLCAPCHTLKNSARAALKKQARVVSLELFSEGSLPLLKLIALKVREEYAERIASVRDLVDRLGSVSSGLTASDLTGLTGLTALPSSGLTDLQDPDEDLKRSLAGLIARARARASPTSNAPPLSK
jgi:hypothetical protein